jgi:hypothetical protein
VRSRIPEQNAAYRHHGFITREGSVQRSVRPAVGDLVDGRLPPLHRVPLADSDEDKGRFVPSSSPPSQLPTVQRDAED